MGDSQAYNDPDTRIAGCFKGPRGVLDFKAEVEHSELRCRIETMYSELTIEMPHQKVTRIKSDGFTSLWAQSRCIYEYENNQ